PRGAPPARACARRAWRAARRASLRGWSTPVRHCRSRSGSSRRSTSKRLSSGRAVATIDRGMRPGRRPMLAARMPRLALDLVRLARPYDWAKSVFVLLPVPFALRAGASLSLGTFALGVAAFSLVASGVYVLNDLRDVEADRAHPKKRSRPIASGAVSPGVAVVWGVALL